VRRQLIAVAIAAAAAGGAGGAAHAQPAPDPGAPPAPGAPGSPGSPGSGDDAPAAGDPGAPAGVPPGVPAGVPAPTGALPPVATAAPADDDIGDQAISAELGVAAGGRVTPGGLRIAGQFLYQLSDEDWFDGAANFTFGSGAAACFRDRKNAVICNHGLADGVGVEVSTTIRHMLARQGSFHPYVRLGVGIGVVRFGNDDVSGFTIPAHGGGGVRVALAPAIAMIVEGDVVLGFGSFSQGIGSQPQLGLAIAAGVEFRLR
jgi:opacity protein-like surface antigen